MDRRAGETQTLDTASSVSAQPARCWGIKIDSARGPCGQGPHGACAVRWGVLVGKGGSSGAEGSAGEGGDLVGRGPLVGKEGF